MLWKVCGRDPMLMLKALKAFFRVGLALLALDSGVGGFVVSPPALQSNARPTSFLLQPPLPEALVPGGLGRYAAMEKALQVSMMAKKSKSKPKGRVATSKTGGFGAKPKLVGKGTEINDQKTSRLIQWLKDGGASVNKVTIADFNGLRGVAALQTIEEGEAVVKVPMELAFNLGAEGSNPGYAAIQLVRIVNDEERKHHGWYQPAIDILPPYEQCDTTDFFSEEELKALEWDEVVEETHARRKLLRSTYEASQIGVTGKHKDIDFSYEEFLWGVYQVVSRAFSIYTDEGGTKYIIPMIDLFNHDASSPHELKCSGGYFQVVAGKRINPGQHINFVYGNGALNNDRILQDYGFVQTDNERDVEQLTMQKTSDNLPGLPFKGMGLDVEGLNDLLSGFSTTLEEDEELMKSDTTSSKMRVSIAFRAEKKRAIRRAIERKMT